MIMRAMVLHAAGEPLRMEERPDPEPAPGELLVRVEACAVCRTDLHVVDGELPQARLPVVPGHEIVGSSAARRRRRRTAGASVSGSAFPGSGRPAAHCAYCLAHRENLCDEPVFTGYSRDGGFATHVIADAAFCLPLDLPQDAVARRPPPVRRADRLARAARSRPPGDANRHLRLRRRGPSHRPGGDRTRSARSSPSRARAMRRRSRSRARSAPPGPAAPTRPPPDPLDAAIIFAPVGALVPAALRAVRKGGRVVCAGIHMSDIPSFPYRLLWEERELVSVANLTRGDARAFLGFAASVPLQVEATPYPLAAANVALDDLRSGRLQGAAVLAP